MKVLPTGLGEIAAKAYLPLLAATPGLDIHLATRDPQRLGDLGQCYRLAG